MWTRSRSKVSPRSSEDRALEMGAYLHITPALKTKLGYGEVRGSYLGPVDKVDERSVCSAQGERFTCRIDHFNAEQDRIWVRARQEYVSDGHRDVGVKELHLRAQDPEGQAWRIVGELPHDARGKVTWQKRFPRSKVRAYRTLTRWFFDNFGKFEEQMMRGAAAPKRTRLPPPAPKRR